MQTNKKVHTNAATSVRTDRSKCLAGNIFYDHHTTAPATAQEPFVSALLHNACDSAGA